jgi:hypothetical protein
MGLMKYETLSGFIQFVELHDPGRCPGLGYYSPIGEYICLMILGSHQLSMLNTFGVLGNYINPKLTIIKANPTGNAHK